MPDQTDAQKRAAARRAKILARGNAGLNKLAQTARGDEAAELYGDDMKEAAPTSTGASDGTPAPVTASASASASATTSQPAMSTQSLAGAVPPPGAGKPNWAPTPGRTPTPSTPGARAAAADPMNAGDMPDFNAFLQQMMAGQGGAGGPGGLPALGAPGMEGDPFGGQNPFAALMGGAGPDGQSPFGAGGMPPGMMPPGMMPPGMMPGMAAAPPSRAQRLFPFVHTLCVLAFTLFVCLWWEPTIQFVRTGGDSSLAAWAPRWAALGGRAGRFAATTIEPLPVFYAFCTLEAMLLATRVVLVRGPPALHPLLANVLPMLPPGIQSLILNGSKYLGAVTQAYRDACVFVFGLGVAIVVAELMNK